MSDAIGQLPPILARTPVCAPLLPLRAANRLRIEGIEQLGQLYGWTRDRLMHALGVRSGEETFAALHELAALPQDRLARLTHTTAQLATLPALPIAVIRELCYAQSVQEEIAALVCDLEARKRAMVYLRWGVGSPPKTLEEIGSTFGLTRERARQIIQAREQMLETSGLRLPVASEAVNDLDEAGGALPARVYELLLRHSPTPVESAHVRLLPLLHRFGFVTPIEFHEEYGLWLTELGHACWIADGDLAQMQKRARRVIGHFLRRFGAVPHAIAERLSPFGRQHALWLTRAGEAEFKSVGEYALPVPLRECRLLRQCRKTLVVTGPLSIDELSHALRRDGFPHLSTDLAVCVLRACPDFVVEDATVAVRSTVKRHDVLSAGEKTGFGLLEANGGAMLWLDFVDAMVARGFSSPMAAVIVRKPAVRQIGPAMYGLRGRQVAPDLLRRLRQRRAELMQDSVPILRTRADGDVLTVDYQLNRFSMQGVLPAPPQLRNTERTWSATFAGHRDARQIRIANGFIWPLRWWIEEQKLGAGDCLHGTFHVDERRAHFELLGQASKRAPVAPANYAEQVERALFGQHI